MALVVGVDLGTQSCKAVVCDDQLSVLGAYQVAIETEYPQPGWAEQDVHRWTAAVERAIGGALAAADVRGDAIVALAFAGQLDGCVAVDAEGAPLYQALIWQDRRATESIAIPRGRLQAITGQVADPSHMAPKIRWLRAHGIRAARYHQPVSYLVEHFTGVAVLDAPHASTTMLCELATGTWSRELLNTFAIEPAELPAIRPTCAIAGLLRRALAGIPAGTPVAVGTGDDFATPLGAGLAAPGSIVCAIGTAEVVGALAAQPVLDVATARAESDPWRALAEPMVETHAYPTGAWFVENPGWMSGGAVRWATRLLGLADDAALDALAASAPPGAGGVTFMPALAGAMTPAWRPEARGAFEGLTAAHERAHLARAVLEGLAFASRDVAQRLAALGLPANDVLVLGGGARSAIGTQLRADALGLPHRVAARTDTCAVGAAMIAAVAAGLVADLVAACALAPPATATFSPQASLDEPYERYRRLVSHRLDLA